MDRTRPRGPVFALAIGALAIAALCHTQLDAWAAEPVPGDLGIFFDLAGTQAVRNGVVPFSPFSFYVISFDVPGGLTEFELSVQLPAGLLISGGRTLPAGAIDSGVGDDNWIVTTGGACLGASGTFVLVAYPGALFLSAVGNDIPICLGKATPSRFPGNAPGYVACDPPGGLHPFGAVYAGCALINRSVPPCYPMLDHLTIAVGTAEAAVGTPVSLLVRCVPTIIPCMEKDSWAPIPVSHVEMDFSWDPAVATLTGARWPYGDPDPPTLALTLGTGTATVVLDRLYGFLDPYFPADLVWLDFVTAAVAGQTPVSLDRVVMIREGLQPPRTETVAGSIVTGSVAAELLSPGALKARWKTGP